MNASFSHLHNNTVLFCALFTYKLSLGECIHVVLPFLCAPFRILYHVLIQNRNRNAIFLGSVFLNSIEASSYRRTDLAIEAEIDRSGAPGVQIDEYERDGIQVFSLSVTGEEGKRSAGRPEGNYVTVTAKRPWLWDDDRRTALVSLLSDLISDAVRSASGQAPAPDLSVLVCGLGNRSLTADAVGPLAADGVTVTARLRDERPELYRELGCCRVYSVAPGVAAATGIEAADVLRGIAATVSPSVIILIDALAARSCERLASTIQIADTGICPGSGIGNKRREITKSSVGIPVVTIGVPTVVDSSTLVYDALEAGGVDLANGAEELRAVLENGRSFFVTPKESDVVTKEMSRIISEAIDMMCRIS